jgi:hypothetical protein
MVVKRGPFWLSQKKKEQARPATVDKTAATIDDAIVVSCLANEMLLTNDNKSHDGGFVMAHKVPLPDNGDSFNGVIMAHNVPLPGDNDHYRDALMVPLLPSGNGNKLPTIPEEDEEDGDAPLAALAAAAHENSKKRKQMHTGDNIEQTRSKRQRTGIKFSGKRNATDCDDDNDEAGPSQKKKRRSNQETP